MTTLSPLKFRHNYDRFNIPGNKVIFNFIVADMIKNGGNLKPSSHWDWNLCGWAKEIDNNLNYYSSELYEKRYSNLQMMLDPFIGVTGMQKVSEDSIKKYEQYLRKIDNLNMLPEKILTFSSKNGWIETDLGSIMDCNMIFNYSYSLADKEKKNRLLKLAEDMVV